MARDYHRLLLLFVDGVGLAAESEHNPLVTSEAPTLAELLGGPLTRERVGVHEQAILTALDATLGVRGLPQSATGQTALFTGVNGARLLGRHATAFPGPVLREVIARESLFRHVAQAGRAVTFANAYTGAYLEQLTANRARRSVTTCAVQAAELEFRTTGDLLAGRAATWDIERDLYAEWTGEPLERLDAVRVGAHLGAVAADHRLTVFETFLADLVGHGRVDLEESEVVRRLDRLLAGVLEARSSDTTVLLTSDHGNFEDRSVRTHTLNPVPLLAVGPAAQSLSRLSSLLEVSPAIRELLEA